MNDIDILEEYVELCKTTGMDKERGQAISNLIAENKELKEENNELKEKLYRARSNTDEH